MVLLPRASAASVIPVVMKLSEANGRVQTIPLNSSSNWLDVPGGSQKRVSTSRSTKAGRY